MSSQDEDLHEDTTEADGELQIITECWVEPQYGEIVNSSPQRKHFDGLTYKELPDAVSYMLNISKFGSKISESLSFHHPIKSMWRSYNCYHNNVKHCYKIQIYFYLGYI